MTIAADRHRFSDPARAVSEIKDKRAAIGEHRLQHVALCRPPLDAALGAHLEPVSAAEEHLHAGIPGHDIEHRVAAPGPGVQFEIRLRHEHL